MGPPSYMRSIVDRNVGMRRVTVYQKVIYTCAMWFHCRTLHRQGHYSTQPANMLY